MSITLEEMSQGYIQSIKHRIESRQELVQHLQECENSLQFEASNDKKCSEGKCEEKKVN